MSLNFYDEEEEIEKSKYETINKYQDLFTPYINESPDLKSALNYIYSQLNLSEEYKNSLVNDIMNRCNGQMEEKFNEIHEKYPNISLEESKIITSYTCESSIDPEYSPYRLLNKNMVTEDRRQGIKNVSKYLFMLLKSLRKLSRYVPETNPKVLYRCINKIVNYKIDTFNDKAVPYLPGNKKTLWGFTSTSYAVNTSYKFLGKNDVLKEGTIFTFNGDLIGYDISLFNVFNEKEILIEPERKFNVEETKPPVNKILQTTCRILETPLVLESIIVPITDINIDSKIIENENNYKNILIHWLQQPNPNIKKDKIKGIELLYRGTRDGFRAKNFHDKCDKKGETLTVILSSDNYIFGGYTEIDWESTTWNGKVGEENCSRRDGIGNEFVYTLKNPHNIQPSKFNMKKYWYNHSICCDVNLGPIFGCNDIRIEDKCNEKRNSFNFYDFKKGEFCFDDTTGKKRLLFTGNDHFTVKEIEVFHIIR